MNTRRKLFLSLIVFILTCTACQSEAQKEISGAIDTVTPGPASIPSQTPTREPVVIEGTVADCRYPFGDVVGIPNATVQYNDISVTTNEQGKFSLVVPFEDRNTFLEISAENYVPYRQRPAGMVTGAFHLIPTDLYRGVYLVLWNPVSSNPQNWHRKWNQQTEFVIVRTGASQTQIDTLLGILESDKYRDMTGGRFTSAIAPTIVDEKPSGDDILGKTVISFEPGIVPGGIAHSEDENGVIFYAEITWNTNEEITPNIVWHEMVHTVTAGGHINEWPSVVSEVESLNGDLSQTDIEIFNCIYNSPPMRTQPDYQP